MSRQHWSSSIKYIWPWKEILLQTELDIWKSKWCYTITLSWRKEGDCRKKNGDACLYKRQAERQRRLRGKVTRKHSDLQENSLWDVRTGLLWERRRDSCRMLVTNKVSGQMGVWERMWLRRTTNDQRTNIIKMIQKYSQWYLQYNSIS